MYYGGKWKVAKNARNTQHATRNRKHVSCFTMFLCVIFLISAVGNAEVENTEKLESEDLLEVIKAKVVDITQIELLPRNRFSDSVEPQIGQSLGIYPKERLWNLPNILTPPKVDLKKLTDNDNYLISLSAYPRLPGSWVYDVLFAGDFQPMRGCINIGSQHLGDKFTNEERGEYNWDRFRASVGYDKNRTDVDVDLKYEVKDLEWQVKSETSITKSLPKNLALLKADFDWNQWITDESLITLDLNGDLFKISGDDVDKDDEGVDLRVKFDVSTYWPFINPISFGGGMDYFSANSASLKREADLSTFKLYARNHYAALGPFVFDLRAELVSTRERNEQGEDRTKMFFNPAVILTTKFSDNAILRTRLNRTIERSSLAERYFYQDQIAINPFLRMPKSWNAQVSLNVAKASRLNLTVSGFAKRVDDLVVLYPNYQTSEVYEFWYPDNIDANLYGGQISLDLVTDRFDVLTKFTHELQESDTVKHIPYRPADRFEFNLTYKAKYGVRFELGGIFCGPRYSDRTEDDTLDGYFIGKTKLIKQIGKYAKIFVGMQLGESEPLAGYKFSENFVDFGINLIL